MIIKMMPQCLTTVLLFTLAAFAGGQTSTAPTTSTPQEQLLLTTTPPSLAHVDRASIPVSHAVAELAGFKESDVKFDLRDLMEILRDRRHEGWVLAAYPDPKTGRPLIGAGFSLDLPAREHPQSDPLNPHPFVEPSSAELWQAAGLDSERLQNILRQYDDQLAMWGTKGFRKRIKALSPQIADEDAALLLRVSAIQAIYNAKGYCRQFDQLTASQQMAVSQLVYQLGVNLQQFSQFLDLLNTYFPKNDAAEAPQVSAAVGDAAYWKTVQQSLTQSQWARLYSSRAVSVIAMLDPRYEDEATMAELRVGAMLRPAVMRRRMGRSVATRQLASYSSTRHSGRAAAKAKLHARSKRKV